MPLVEWCAMRPPQQRDKILRFSGGECRRVRHAVSFAEREVHLRNAMREIHVERIAWVLGQELPIVAQKISEMPLHRILEAHVSAFDGFGESMRTACVPRVANAVRASLRRQFQDRELAEQLNNGLRVERNDEGDGATACGQAHSPRQQGRHAASLGSQIRPDFVGRQTGTPLSKATIAKETTELWTATRDSRPLAWEAMKLPEPEQRRAAAWESPPHRAIGAQATA
mmetsp:Transcript_100706/g.284006  ORF Transcript_100706/g.284006 Transcript_100706/m.284006 type:complete len:227 (+) Transcript_100706:889-1569(+)